MPGYVECAFFVPLLQDKNLSEGQKHGAACWRWLKGELDRLFDGATQAPGKYKGFYRDPDTGEKVEDDSTRFLVALPEKNVPRLRRLLGEACCIFKQKRIYLSVAGKVEFIEGTP